jgi:hypothetical protein
LAASSSPSTAQAATSHHDLPRLLGGHVAERRERIGFLDLDPLRWLPEAAVEHEADDTPFAAAGGA